MIFHNSRINISHLDYLTWFKTYIWLTLWFNRYTKVYYTIKMAKIDTIRSHKRMKFNLHLNACGCTYMARKFYFIWCQSWCIAQYSPIDCHILKSSQKDFHGLAVIIVRKYSDVCLKQPYGNWQSSLFLLPVGDIKTSLFLSLKLSSKQLNKYYAGR